MKRPTPQQACAKYKGKPGIMKGCLNCAKTMPFKVDACIACGPVCLGQVCKGKPQDKCLASPEFRACHGKCVRERPGPKVQQGAGKQPPNANEL